LSEVIKCPKCGQTFASKEEMAEHTKEHLDFTLNKTRGQLKAIRARDDS